MKRSDNGRGASERRFTHWGAVIAIGVLLFLGAAGGWVAFGLIRGAPTSTSGIRFSRSSAIAPFSLIDSDASPVLNAVENELRSLDLARAQVEAIKDQVPKIIIANVAGSFEEYMTTVLSWGATPIERISDADLSALRERWASREWLSIDLKGLRMRRAYRGEDGFLYMPSDHGEDFGPLGVMVESIVDFGVDVPSLVRSGAPIIDVGFPAEIVGKRGEAELIAMHFAMIWSSERNRWVPFNSRAISKNPIDGFTN